MNDRPQTPRENNSGRGQLVPNNAAGNPRIFDRDSYRAYQNQERRNSDWSEKREYTPRDDGNKRKERNTNRMKAFQQKKKTDKPDRKPEAPKPEMAK